MNAEALTNPVRVWSRNEVLARLSPVPAVSGVYAWHFRAAPYVGLSPGLLYVGISPARLNSTQHLRRRVQYHYRGNAEGSTLRRSLGCLLGLELQRVGSGKRLTFGKNGEAWLSQWMAEHAHVCWVQHNEPWVFEHQLISTIDLPLNLQHNQHNAFYPVLKRLRASAKARAMELPIRG